MSIFIAINLKYLKDNITKDPAVVRELGEAGLVYPTLLKKEEDALIDRGLGLEYRPNKSELREKLKSGIIITILM